MSNPPGEPDRVFALPQGDVPHFDPHAHEYVSSACAHRRHDFCDDGCRFCGAVCLCACHRWRLRSEHPSSVENR